MLLKELEQLLTSGSGEAEGKVSLGIVASLAEDLMGPIVERLGPTHPR